MKRRKKGVYTLFPLHLLLFLAPPPSKHAVSPKSGPVCERGGVKLPGVLGSVGVCGRGQVLYGRMQIRGLCADEWWWAWGRRG